MISHSAQAEYFTLETNDFIAKFQIALKECYETEYWLELFVKSENRNMFITAVNIYLIWFALDRHNKNNLHPVP